MLAILLKKSGDYFDPVARAEELAYAQKPDFVTISLSSLPSIAQLADKLEIGEDLSIPVILENRLHYGFVYDRFESKFLQKNST